MKIAHRAIEIDWFWFISIYFDVFLILIFSI